MCGRRQALTERYLALGVGGNVVRRCSRDRVVGLLMSALHPNPFAPSKLTAQTTFASPTEFLQSHDPSAAPSLVVDYDLQNLDEAARWCHKALAVALPLASATCLAKTRRKLNVATVFSGIGAPEHACAFLQAAFKGAGNEIEFSFISACESARKRQAGAHDLV